MAKKKVKRVVTIFPVYHHDASFLSRLAESVEKDESMQLEWRAATVGLLRQLIVTFRQAGASKVKTGE